ncbi:hypothetical protein, partial [Vulcaniibacterium thermophilum]
MPNQTSLPFPDPEPPRAGREPQAPDVGPAADEPAHAAASPRETDPAQTELPIAAADAPRTLPAR